MACPSELLAERDPVVIAAFCDHWEVDPADADALFEDTVAWLWLATRPGAPPLSITEPLRIVDEMWHEFLLHSTRYAAFCERWFGRYVHHEPTPQGAGHVGDALHRRVHDQGAFIAKELGVGRLLRWYVELPQRFDDAWFQRARRHRPMRYQPTAKLLAQWQAWRRQTGADVGG
jgi:hypothetical protein